MVQSLDDARRRQNRSGGGRVPPHNLQAEESLLGAMLLSKDAISAAVEICGGADFYKPAHSHVYDAVVSLFGQGEPADPVTVAEELRRADLLEAIGGPSILTDLQANTPAVSNASRYARIVEEHALLRRLIGVAGEIAEMGYSLPDDVTEAVDRAESMVFEVAQRRVADTLVPINDLLRASLDHLEKLYERSESITGTPTGYTGLDELLSGLQPSALNVVGARPGAGKALALTTPIPTVDGWTTMGGLQVGDRLFDDRGQPCAVTYLSPVYLDRSCFEVEFDDGSVVVADAEHQWLVGDPPAGDERARFVHPRVVTTQQMVDDGVVTTDSRRPRPNWYVPVTDPLDLPTAELAVDPYVLGCRLGHRSSGGSSPLALGGNDADHFAGQFDHAGFPSLLLGWGELEAVEYTGGRIPAAYLRGSVKQRLALLQGLMDVAGAAATGGRVELTLADHDLLRQARELTLSLGHTVEGSRPTLVRTPAGWLAEMWRLCWAPADPVFRLPRKAAAQTSGAPNPAGRATGRAIVAIRPTATVPVRCITVSSPSHLYLAGETMIPTHNTAFALGIAAHAAIEAHKPVLLFSLEMSHHEVTQRLLSSEAKVDSTRLRNGRLLESDWNKISHAIGRLSESPIFIDDNPNVTVMEIRAKARRMKSRLGDLGVIIVDYLQLMTGRKAAENRQVEVSEISRGLKILARELETPVVALSQLSRGLEMRAEKRPVLADLRESGCMPASTRVLRADNGEEVTLGELVLSQEHPLVWSIDERHRLVPARVLKAFPSGIKAVFDLRLASGRSVQASANHPFLTIGGWARLDTLDAGSFVAVPRRVPAPLHPATDWSDDEVALLAHMLGAGTMGSGFKYATSDAANKAAVEDAVRRLFGIEASATKVGNTWSIWFPSPYRLTRGLHHPMRNWLEPHGLWKSRGWTKFVPSPIFGLDDKQASLFLHHLWATGGSITIGRNGRGPLVRTYYATTSRRLALDVQRLLLRFGVRSTIGTSKKQRAGQPLEGVQHYRTGYSVRIQGAGSQARFLRSIGCHGASAVCIPDALAVLDKIKANPNLDLVPWPVAAKVRAAAADAGVTHRQLAERLGEAYGGSYLLGTEDRPRRFSRDRLAAMADIVGSPGLPDVATSDLYWDRVVEIAPAGERPTFDVTIEGTSNFIADGIIAHNSIEQDSDVVMFIYRDELYNPESPDRGTAEIIVAKHRNGPTGVTQLAFLDRYTRFANMARV